MKLFVTTSIFVLLFTGIIMLTFPVHWFPSFYDVRYMGCQAFIGTAVIVLVPLVLRVQKNRPDARKKNHAADLLQFALIIAIMSNAIGDLGLYELYKVGFQFDKMIHFSTSLLSVLILPVILHERFGIHITIAVAISFLVVVACGLGWELYEYLADNFFGTHIYGVYGSDKINDTKFDLIFDALGAITGTIISIFKR